jgi:hypothetical protein
MTSNVVAIAQGIPALELGLTGVPVHEVTAIDEVETLVAGLLESEARVVIVDERFRDQFSEWMVNRLHQHSGLPLVIYCPLFTEEEAGTDAYINSIVRPAIGFEIRLD